MWEFAIQHEIITLILALSFMWATERTITAIANRNKPVVKCPCCEDEEETEEE